MLSFVSQRHQLACEVHEKAIQMEDSQYQKLSRLAKVDLEQYVRPLDDYANEYLCLIQNG